MASDDLELLRGMASQMHAQAREAADQARALFTKPMSAEASDAARHFAIAAIGAEWTAGRIEQALLTLITSEARAPSDTPLMN